MIGDRRVMKPSRRCRVLSDNRKPHFGVKGSTQEVKWISARHLRPSEPAGPYAPGFETLSPSLTGLGRIHKPVRKEGASRHEFNRARRGAHQTTVLSGTAQRGDHPAGAQRAARSSPLVSQ